MISSLAYLLLHIQVIKIGTSSLINEKYGTLNLSSLSRICEVVRELHAKGKPACQQLVRYQVVTAVLNLCSQATMRFQQAGGSTVGTYILLNSPLWPQQCTHSQKSIERPSSRLNSSGSKNAIALQAVLARSASSSTPFQPNPGCKQCKTQLAAAYALTKRFISVAD